jgi:hypothetical protein
MKLTLQQLEAHLWGAANILRGKTAGQDYKNYILSLMFYKRLCDQWEWEADEAIAVQERQQGGSAGEVDLRPELQGPIFEPFHDPAYCRQLTIHPEFRTLCWPNGADIAPETLYEAVRVAATGP